MRQKAQRTPLLVIILILFIVLPFTGLSDGYRVKKWLTMEDVVSESDIIVTGKIINCDHLYGTRYAYGRENKYIRQYRVKFRINKILYGKDNENVPPPGYSNNATRDGILLPGKWLLIDKLYGESYNLRNCDKKQNVIIYFKLTNDNYKILYIDTINKLKKLKRIIKFKSKRIKTK